MQRLNFIHGIDSIQNSASPFNNRKAFTNDRHNFRRRYFITAVFGKAEPYTVYAVRLYRESQRHRIINTRRFLSAHYRPISAKKTNNHTDTKRAVARIKCNGSILFTALTQSRTAPPHSTTVKPLRTIGIISGGVISSPLYSAKPNHIRYMLSGFTEKVSGIALSTPSVSIGYMT